MGVRPRPPPARVASNHHSIRHRRDALTINLGSYFFAPRDFNERKIVQTNDAQFTKSGMYAIGMKA